jgi:hypothetical protein
MNQSYFQKNLPASLQFWVRPMLLLSLGLHGVLLALPLPSEKKPAPPAKKEPEKIKITQLPTTPPAPNASPRPVVRATPRPTPQVRPSIRPQPSPIRQRMSDIPPIPPLTRATPRPQPQLTPSPTPTPSQATATPSPTPTPSQATATQSPTPSQATATPSPTPTPSQATATPSPQPTPEQSPNLLNPFADFPFPDNAQPGSLGLLPGETDKAARNITDGLEQVVAFYNTALPAKNFKSQQINEAAEFKVFKVSKEGAESQFLHLISKEGKTVIVLAPQEIKDLNALKSAEARSAEEIAFDNALAPIKQSEDFGAVFPEDLGKLPQPQQFADINKFRGIIATTTFKPMSPEDLFNDVNTKLVEAGFTQITSIGSYGGGQAYKVSQGSFTTYLYFVANRDNKTIMLVSKDAP